MEANMVDLPLLDGMPADRVTAMLGRAPGNELGSGKFSSPESSAALAVNAFGWFLHNPQLVPKLPNAPDAGTVRAVELEYCARFPWAGGRHPWLDAALVTDSHLIGIESKRFEPFRDTKSPNLSVAYDRPVWGDGMAPFERMRDSLRSHPARYALLDAAQLVKHAFGLVTDARRHGKRPHLHYLFAEPYSRAGKAISNELWAAHRAEVADFSMSVADAEVSFSACSYREWFASWRGPVLTAHATRLVEAFNP
jgi:hypothetical protein